MTEPRPAPLRVIKLGGSLLSNPSLPERFKSWSQRQPPAVQVIVCGGGTIVDALRDYASLWKLSEEFSHDVAIELTSATSQLFAEVLQLPLCASWQELASLLDLARQSTAQPLTIIFDYSHWSVAINELEKSWRITSDSVAAVIAIQLEADELALLKSCEVPEFTDIDYLRQKGIVDDAFADFSPLLSAWRVESLT